MHLPLANTWQAADKWCYNLHVLKKIDYILIISFAALFTFIALFLFRSADDNRLFNWQWVFAAFLIGTAVGVPIAYIMPMTAVPQRTALSHACGALAAAVITTLLVPWLNRLAAPAAGASG